MPQKPALSTYTAREAQRDGRDAFQLLGDTTAFETAATAPIVPMGYSLDTHVGEVFRDKPVIGLSGVVSHIDSGASVKVPNGIMTFSFLEKNHLTGLYNNPTLGFTAGNGVSPFSTAQRAEARDSIKLWDDLVPITFVETKGTGADIRLANSFDPAQAYAYYPTKQGYTFQSDVFIADPAMNTSNNWLGFNGYGATTLIHELGHTLGLSHPGSYNYDPNLDLTYANYAEYAQDSTQYSIMSYWRASETGASIRDWSTLQLGNAQSPLLHDILTIQAKYGADPTTRTGDTTYGFNSNAGRDIYDFSANKFPYLSIYDAGGIDTIDLSGFKASVFLDLHAGSFSSAGQAIPTLSEITAARAALSEILEFNLTVRSQAFVDNLANTAIARNEAAIFADTGVHGINATEFMNLSIAYATTIENGIGGSQRDLLWGNAAANVLKGMAGDDVLDGFEGADTLWGGAGNDTFTFHLIEKGDKIADFESGHDKIDLTGTGVDFTWIGSGAFTNQAGQLRFADGVLSGDVNGDGVADLSINVVGDVLVTDVMFG